MWPGGKNTKFESAVNKYTMLDMISLIFLYTEFNVCVMSESHGRFLPVADRRPHLLTCPAV